MSADSSAPVAPVAPAAPAAPKRTSSTGCLGCFSMVCMLLFTAANVFALHWIDPNWLDEVSFWKGKKWESEPTMLTRPLPSDLPPPITRTVRAYEDRPVAISHLGATAQYVPGKPTVLVLPDGARMELPAGALPIPFEISLSPVISVPAPMAAPFCGGVYDFRAGSLEHVTFRKPVKVTVPYDPTQVTSGSPTLAVWEDGKGWKKLATIVDPATKTLRANMPHASILGAIGFAFGSGYALFGTEKGGRVWTGVRTGWENITHPFSKVYRTENFAIHYYVKGSEAVPEDELYLDKNGRGSSETPLYVIDMGTALEEALVRLAAIGIDVPKAKVLRWDVFVGNAGTNVYGSTPYGGPIFMSTFFQLYSLQDGMPLQVAMRNTAAHELAHLAQPAAVGSAVASNAAKPFMEGTAAYFGEAAWKGTSYEGSALAQAFLKSDDSAGFTQKTWAGSPAPMHYEWGNLFRALDQVHGEGKGLLVARAMMDGKQLSYEGLESAMKGLNGDAADAVEATARVFYHDDFWRGDFAPHHHRRWSREAFSLHRYGPPHENFVQVSLAEQSGRQVINHGESVFAVAAPPGTAFAIYAWVSPLPKWRKPKLAMLIEPKGPMLKFLVAAEKVDGSGGKFGMPNLPLRGAPGEFVEHDSTDGRWKRVWENVGREGPSLFTVLTVNQSMRSAAPGWTVHRWLLLAPDKIKAERLAGKNQYKVTWERAPLRDSTQTIADGSRYFKEYRLYRKKSSEPVGNFELIRPSLDVEEYVDSPPFEENWVYSVKVVDTLGNTSEYGRWNEDPFAGTWEGEFRLVSGSLIDPLNVYLEKEMSTSEAKRRAEIAKIADPNDRANAVKSLEENLKMKNEYWPKVKEFLEQFEQLCRAGPPVTVEITPDGVRGADEYYRVKMTHMVYAPLEDKSGPPMKGTSFKRSSFDTLEMVMDLGPALDAEDAAAMAKIKAAFPPIKLKLCHVDEEKGYYEIREKSYTMKPEIDGKPAHATITWSLEKQSVRAD